MHKEIGLEILGTLTPKACIRKMKANPIFLQTILREGQIDPSIVAKVSLSMSASELEVFTHNMIQEINQFNNIIQCKKLEDLEQVIPKLIPQTKCYVWSRMVHSDLAICSSLKAFVRIGKSVIGIPFEDSQDFVCEDPTLNERFSVATDLPICQGCKLMLLLPLNENFVLQVLISSIAEDVEKSYLIEMVKVLRDQAKTRFDLECCSAPDFSQLFDCIEQSSRKESIKRLQNCLSQWFSCDSVDFFLFDQKQQQLIDLKEDTRLDEKTGGVSFAAAKEQTETVINIPHSHDLVTQGIDSKYSNKSLLLIATVYKKNQFVVTLRGKQNSAFFAKEDCDLLKCIIPAICKVIELSKWSEQIQKECNLLQCESHVSSMIKEALELATCKKDGGKRALAMVSRNLFQTDTFFVAIFDGRNMQFHPTGVTWKFEDCAAGTAYNRRQRIVTKPESDNELYLQLGITAVTSTISFPLREEGKVIGAVEVINPAIEPDTDVCRLFSNLVALCRNKT